MKPQQKDVIRAINAILKTKERYCVADIRAYLAQQNIYTTRKEVIDTIVTIIQGDKKDR